MATPAPRSLNPAPDPASDDRVAWAEARAAELVRRYAGRDGLDLLRPIIATEFPGRIAVSSSFGAEAAVMLDLVAQADPATPVIFLDTGKLFGETIRYRQTLTALLGLTDVRIVRPTEAEVRKRDPDGILWTQSPDACCTLRKVEPFALALDGFDAWITGIRRDQSSTRANAKLIEWDQKFQLVKVNPLAKWRWEDVWAYIRVHEVPYNALHDRDYPSIGCTHCTSPVMPGEDPRAGRWKNFTKTECGLHKAS